MKAALVGARRHAAARGAPRHRPRARPGRRRRVDPRLRRRSARVRRASSSARPRPPPASPCPASSTPSAASPSTPPTSAGATSRCATCSASGSAASRSPSATTCAPAASPRDGSAPARAPTGSCSCRWAPGIAGAIGIDGAHRGRAPTATPGEIGHIVVRPGRPALRLRPARLSGDARLRRRREPGLGRGVPATRTRTPRTARKAVESGRPAGPGASGRTPSTRSPRARHRAHPAGPAHADHRWRSRRGRGNLVHTAAGRGRANGVTFQKLPSIVPAALGDTAGCLGAGLLAWDLLDHGTPPRYPEPDDRRR